MHLADVPDPVVGETDVPAHIHASSINLLDSKMKSGEFKAMLPYKFPLIMGHDLAGVVLKVGSRVPTK